MPNGPVKALSDHRDCSKVNKVAYNVSTVISMVQTSCNILGKYSEAVCWKKWKINNFSQHICRLQRIPSVI